MTRRRLDYDVLRVCAMLAVVYLHTAARPLLNVENGPVWHFANLVTALCTAAVPLFFMLSGALLLREETAADLRVLFGRRLPRVVLPLLAWSGIALAIVGLREGWDRAGALGLTLLQNSVLVPYWFLYALIPMYLILPLLKRMTDRLDGGLWRYLLLLWAAVSLGVRTVHDFLPAAWQPALQLHWTLNADFIGGYLGYFLLGAALDRWKRPPSRRTLWVTAVLLWLVIALGTAWDTARSGVHTERFKSYLSLFTALLAAAIFLLARSYLKGRESGRWMGRLSRLSFGVYFLHPMAVTFWRESWAKYFPDTLWAHVLLYLTVLACCLAAAAVLAAIPGISLLFTGQSQPKRRGRREKR